MRLVVANTVLHSLNRSNRKLKLPERKLFDPLLDVLEQPKLSFQLTPIALAIQEIFRK
jgi:hypothetical protein